MGIPKPYTPTPEFWGLVFMFKGLGSRGLGVWGSGGLGFRLYLSVDVGDYEDSFGPVLLASLRVKSFAMGVWDMMRHIVPVK